MKEAVSRSGVDPLADQLRHRRQLMPTDSRYAYVSRVASIQAGLSMDSVAMQVSRLCASGLQGIVTTAQNIMLGDADYGIGGGVEVMSKATYLMPALRSGARMGDTKAIDSMVAVLTDPFGVGHMGITAENLATKHGFTREEQDALAVESSVAPRLPSPKVVSSRRSSRSSNRPARAKWCSTPTSTSSPTPRWNHWPR
jgi:acetyl-CoA C-acetyltransferase